MKRSVALLLVFCLLLGLAACGGDSGGGYKIIERMGNESFSVAFRSGDRLCEYVTAAMAVLTASGALHQTALSWFSGDQLALEGDASALDPYIDEIPRRTVIIGVDTGSFPMAFVKDDGSFAGFDVDMMSLICERLGWSYRFIAIAEDDAATELASGNIDCACGGIGFKESNKWSLTPSYLTNELVLVVPRDSDINTARKLKGRTVSMGHASKYAKALESVGKVSSRIGKIILADGNDVCFGYLDIDFCDAIVVDSVAANYYMR